MANESLQSNAQNFPGFASGGVDARTGLYTFTLSLPNVTTSDLLGPEFALALTFNPIGGDNWGLGAGWSTNLSHVNLEEPRLLKLSTGEQFRIDGSGEEPGISERKLPSFRYLQLSAGSAQIIHRSGAVEHLSRPGAGEYLMPHMLQSPTGHSLHLSYVLDEGRPRLAQVTDDHGQAVIELTKVGQDIVIKMAVGEFRMRFADDRLQQLDLPASVGGAWTFEYTGKGVPYANITRVTQPLGGIETLSYDSNHLVPGNGMPPVPRVSRHEVSPGQGLVSMVNEYVYGADNHNFLGYGGISDWLKDGSDNLYRASPGYTYEVIHRQINGDERRSTRRVYNSFHLCTLETTQQGACVTERQTTYHLIPGAPFSSQPAQFQLPRTVTTTWRMEGQPQARSETTTTEFDTEGNIVRQIEPSGQETHYAYYPAHGETDEQGIACPADPWGFKRHYRTITQYPAREPGDGWYNDVTVTTYRHALVECVEAPPGKSPPVGKSVQAASIHIRSTRGGATSHHRQLLEYYHAPSLAERYLHGRVKRRTEHLWEEAAPDRVSSSVEEHSLERIPPPLSQDARGRLRTRVVYTAHDGASRSATREQDIATGLTLLSEDQEGTQVTYSYDALQRLLQARVEDPDAPAARTFAYQAVAADGWPQSLQTSAAGVTTRVVFDRLGRPIERHQAEGWQAGNGKREEDGLYWKGRYDGFGRLIEETSFDDFGGAAQVQALVQYHAYDDWGYRASTTLPDGTRQITVTSPFGTAGQITEQWQEGIPDANEARGRQATTRTELGRYGKPVKVEVLTAEGGLEQWFEYRYDGWGQCIEQTEQFRMGTGLSAALRTAMRYDPWGRLIETIQPNGDQFMQAFAEHSREALVGALSYRGYGKNAAEPTVIATRTFDGVGNVRAYTQGGRTVNYGYTAQGTAPAQVRQPDGSTIDYTYKPSLTAGPLTAKGSDLNFNYAYDKTTGQLLTADPADSQGKPLTADDGAIANAYEYSLTGQLLQETRRDAGTAYTTAYQQTFGGRRVARTDNDVGTSRYHYDTVGRLREQQVIGTEGEVIETATLEYDAFGQLHRRRCGALITESSYDSLGRETERQVLRDGNPVLRYLHVFNGNGNLAERSTFDETGQRVLHEAFEYDKRNRLTIQTNQGEPTTLPRDRFRQPVVQQIFEFDALDNVVLDSATYADGGLRMSTAIFNEQDPCQLASLTHTLLASNKTVRSQTQETFTYDANGRLTDHEGGVKLTYDAFGRLATLTLGTENERRYRYDPHGSLCAVREAEGNEQQRFYDGLSIDHLRRGTAIDRYLSTSGIPLAAVTDDSVNALVTDRNGSVTGEWREGALRTAVYDAYGNSQNDEPLACELGFNGELREGSGSDLYLLGRGYRLYNAALMRFLAPDDASPFGEGGLNPYAYCRGNPVMLYDPTGHMPQWTVANMPYYVPPPEEEKESGGFLGGLFKMVGWAFIGWESFSLLKLGALALTATTGGLMAAGAAAVGVAAAALGVGIATMIDEDNEGLMYAAIAVGVFSGMAGSAATKALKVGRVAGQTSRRASVTSLSTADDIAPGNATPLRRSSVSGVSGQEPSDTLTESISRTASRGNVSFLYPEIDPTDLEKIPRVNAQLQATGATTVPSGQEASQLLATPLSHVSGSIPGEMKISMYTHKKRGRFGNGRPAQLIQRLRTTALNIRHPFNSHTT